MGDEVPMGDEELDEDARYAEHMVETVIQKMPLQKLGYLMQPRRAILTNGEPLNFYGANDGKLHANGGEFHIKGINCTPPRVRPLPSHIIGLLEILRDPYRQSCCTVSLCLQGMEPRVSR